MFFKAARNAYCSKLNVEKPIMNAASRTQTLPWAIIIIVFVPVAIGMTIFGWYAWRGEYDGEIKT